MKSVIGLMTFAANEPVYGTGVTLTGSLHTTQLSGDFPIFQTAYSYDGARKASMWSGGTVRGTTPSGKSVEGTVTAEMKGLGSAYGASAFVPNIQAYLNASNLTGSLSASNWVFAPNALGTTPSSLGLAVYDRGELLNISGGLCNFSFAADGPGIVTATFKVQGIPSAISDVTTPPARTWISANIIPPKCENVALVIGTYTTATVRKFEFDMGQEIVARTNLNSSGSFGGYAFGRRAPTFKLTIESDAISSFNPYTDHQNAVQRAISLQVGAAGTNNAFVVSMPSASLSNVQRSNDGPCALWELQYTPSISAPDTSDDFSITFIP